ncbi:recombinase family protein [Clostridium perfringens]|nr:recombinase family protein [Clostridium perfringens]MDK0791749.1 recombinase family protein [Clostridium perfringens]
MNKTFYYVRISSKEQNPQRQLDYLKEINLNIDERDIYIDKETGKNFSREQYQLLKKILRKGDVLYVKSIDRFGRNYSEILNEWQYLTKKIGIDIVILDMPLLDTRKNKDILGNLISDLVLQLLSYVADTEYKNIKTRQLEGIASAKSRGIKFGRPKQTIDFNSDFKKLYYQWKEGKITTKFFKKTLGLKNNTFYRRIYEFESMNL